MRQIFLSSKKARHKQSQAPIIIHYDQELEDMQQDVINQYIYQNYPIQLVIQCLKQEDFTKYIIQEGISVYMNIISSLRLHIQNYKTYLFNNDDQIPPVKMFIRQLQLLLSCELLKHFIENGHIFLQNDQQNTQQVNHLRQNLESLESQIQLVHEIFYFLLICSSKLTQNLQGNDNLFIHISQQLTILCNQVISTYHNIQLFQDIQDKSRLIQRLDGCLSKIMGFFYNTVEASAVQIQFLTEIFPQIIQLPYILHIPRVLLYFQAVVENMNFEYQNYDNQTSHIQLRKVAITKFFIYWLFSTRISTCIEKLQSTNIQLEHIQNNVQHQNQQVNTFTQIISDNIDITQDYLYQILEYINSIGIELIGDQYSTGNSDEISSQDSYSIDNALENNIDDFQINNNDYINLNNTNNFLISQSIESIIQMQMTRILNEQYQDDYLLQLCMSAQIESIIFSGISIIMQLQYLILSYLVKKYKKLRHKQLTMVINFYYDAIQTLSNQVNDNVQLDQQSINDNTCGLFQSLNIVQFQMCQAILSALNLSDLCITCGTQDNYTLILLGQQASILCKQNDYLDQNINIMRPSNQQLGIYDLNGCLTENPLKNQFLEIFLQDSCKGYINTTYKKTIQNCQRDKTNRKYINELNDIFQAVFQIIQFLTYQQVRCNIFIGHDSSGFDIQLIIDTIPYLDNMYLNECAQIIGIFYNVYQDDARIQILTKQFIQHVERITTEQQLDYYDAMEIISSITWILDQNVLN